MEALINALKQRIAEAETEIAALVKAGEERAAELKAAVITELKALLALLG